MTALARSRGKHALLSDARLAYALYEKFRPEIPSGASGWGAKGEFSIDLVMRLANAGPRDLPESLVVWEAGGGGRDAKLEEGGEVVAGSALGGAVDVQGGEESGGGDVSWGRSRLV